MKADQNLDSPDKWEEYKESIPNFDKTSWRANTLLEQMSATKDKSDYLWYTFRYLIAEVVGSTSTTFASTVSFFFCLRDKFIY